MIHAPMITTVTQENTVEIPAGVAQRFGIQPGCKLDWRPVDGKEEIIVRVILERGEVARGLFGAGRKFAPERDGVAETRPVRQAEG